MRSVKLSYCIIRAIVSPTLIPKCEYPSEPECFRTGQRKAAAQEKYSEFVLAGIGNPSIWDYVAAPSLLGVEGFAEGLRHLLTEKQQIREIRKGQRFVGAAEIGEAVFNKKPQQSIQGSLPSSTLS